MSGTNKLSLFAAMFVNINIMLGTGVFINTVKLAQEVGGLAPLLYGIAGLLMLPLVLSIARLMDFYEEGTFYTFGAALSPYWGFISTWCYFIGKLATPTLGIHAFNLFLQKSFPACASYSIFALDVSILALFIFLNMFSGRLSKKIQFMFLVTKSVPLLFAIGVGLWFFDFATVASPTMIWEGMPFSLPLVIFCFLGFEASCSLSKIIDNPQKNASKAIIYSFFIVITLLMVYQFLFYACLGDTLAQQASYVDAFPALIQKSFPSLLHILTPLLSLAIAASALGGAYGILFSNAWNLHTLAQHNYLPASRAFAHCTAANIPFLCILAEGIVCLGFLALTKGAQIPLQYTSVLAGMTAYAISIASLNKVARSPLSILGLTSCCIGIFFCVRAFIFTNAIPLYFFASILILGTVLYVVKKPSATLTS
jgi:amino acid transporter